MRTTLTLLALFAVLCWALAFLFLVLSTSPAAVAGWGLVVTANAWFATDTITDACREWRREATR